ALRPGAEVGQVDAQRALAAARPVAALPEVGLGRRVVVDDQVDAVAHVGAVDELEADPVGVLHLGRHDATPAKVAMPSSSITESKAARARARSAAASSTGRDTAPYSGASASSAASHLAAHC